MREAAYGVVPAWSRYVEASQWGQGDLRHPLFGRMTDLRMRDTLLFVGIVYTHRKCVCRLVGFSRRTVRADRSCADSWRLPLPSQMPPTIETIVLTEEHLKALRTDTAVSSK